MLTPYVLAQYAQKVYYEAEPHLKHNVKFRRRSGALVSQDLYAHVYFHELQNTKRAVPIIAFCGTPPENISNWITDLKQYPVYHSELGFGPAGFTHGAEELFIKLLESSITYKKHSIALCAPVLVGHSLGGALAQRVTASIIMSQFPRPRQLTVFNSPLPGGRKLRKILRGPGYVHYRHAGDLVSNVDHLFGLYVQALPVYTVGKFLSVLDAHKIENFLNPDLY